MSMTTVGYRDDLLKRLEDPEYSALYLDEVIATGDRPQAFDQNIPAVGDHGVAHRAVAATTGQGVGQIAQIQVITGSLDPVGQVLGGRTEPVGRR